MGKINSTVEKFIHFSKEVDSLKREGFRFHKEIKNLNETIENYSSTLDSKESNPLTERIVEENYALTRLIRKLLRMIGLANLIDISNETYIKKAIEDFFYNLIKENSEIDFKSLKLALKDKVQINQINGVKNIITTLHNIKNREKSNDYEEKINGFYNIFKEQLEILENIKYLKNTIPKTIKLDYFLQDLLKEYEKQVKEGKIPQIENEEIKLSVDASKDDTRNLSKKISLNINNLETLNLNHKKNSISQLKNFLTPLAENISDEKKCKILKQRNILLNIMCVQTDDAILGDNILFINPLNPNKKDWKRKSFMENINSYVKITNLNLFIDNVENINIEFKGDIVFTSLNRSNPKEKLNPFISLPFSSSKFSLKDVFEKNKKPPVTIKTDSKSLKTCAINPLAQKPL
jgi:hypothetical protein